MGDSFFCGYPPVLMFSPMKFRVCFTTENGNKQRLRRELIIMPIKLQTAYLSSLSYISFEYIEMQIFYSNQSVPDGVYSFCPDFGWECGV